MNQILIVKVKGKPALMKKKLSENSIRTATNQQSTNQRSNIKQNEERVTKEIQHAEQIQKQIRTSKQDRKLIKQPYKPINTPEI